jgi:hypothetical protein
MGFWVSLGEWLNGLFRDKRERFHRDLASLGLPLRLRPPGAPEDRVEPLLYERPGLRSLGTISIRSGPIRWVSVLVERRDEGDVYVAAYGVPDARLAYTDLSGLWIDSVKVRDFPFVGRVCDTQWEGQDMGLGLLSALSSQKLVNAGLVDSGTISIRAHSAHRCWTLALDLGTPSLEEWHAYEAVAACLLRAKLPHSRAARLARHRPQPRPP